MASTRFSLNIETSNIAVTQSTEMNFNSFCEIGGKYLAANEDGIYSISECIQASGDTIGWGDGDIITWGPDTILWDNLGEGGISAYFSLVKTDFGIPNQKRLRAVHIGYESDDDLSLTVTVDDHLSRAFTLPAVRTSLNQHGSQKKLSRDLKGRYFEFKIANTNGCDFSIDSIILTVNVLGRKPRGV